MEKQNVKLLKPFDQVKVKVRGPEGSYGPKRVPCSRCDRKVRYQVKINGEGICGKCYNDLRIQRKGDTDGTISLAVLKAVKIGMVREESPDEIFKRVFEASFDHALETIKAEKIAHMARLFIYELVNEPGDYI